MLQDGVKFFAVLGNHDDPRQIGYRDFNMGGERYYSFAPPEDLLTRLATRVEFFALDSTNLDRGQLRWLDERLAASKASLESLFLPSSRSIPPAAIALRHLRFASRSRRFSWRARSTLSFSGHEHIYQRSHVHQRGPVFHQRRRGFIAARRRNADDLYREDIFRGLSLHAG